jgi:dipeptidyl aminopeptidase/acylaminoacyl peptidase
MGNMHGLSNLLRNAMLVVAALAASSSGAAAVPTAEDFAARPAIEDVVLSPSGRRMAMLVFDNNGRSRLGVIDLDPIGPPRIVAAFGDANITRASWVNEDRLIFEGFQDGAIVRAWGGGTWAVNHDGSHLTQLIAWAQNTDRAGSRIASRILPYGWFFLRTIDGSTPDVLVYREVEDALGDAIQIQVSRLDTVTRMLRSLNLNLPDGVRRWVLDAKVQPRMVVAHQKGRSKVYWRAATDEGWTEVADFDPLKEPGFSPRWIDDDDSVVVSARASGDTVALYRWDPKTRRIDPEPLAQVAGFDLSASLETDPKTGRLLGLHAVLDQPTSVWFDAEMQRLQRAIDAALPKGRSNQLHCGHCQSTRFFVVRSASDRQPGEYFLFDRSKASLQRIGLARPRLDEATQGSRSYHRVPTRDGLSMPLYVTHPPAVDVKMPLPAVVLVHGGPWSRGASTHWSEQAQFLATRGYHVLEPEYRGSEGYGFRHFQAGWKQWGSGMQHDLVDAIRWASQHAGVDPARVCVVGASYGGYAALMAPIVQPGAFRCAASFAGVTDIDLMYDIHWSDLSDEHKRYGMPTLIGDQQRKGRCAAGRSVSAQARGRTQGAGAAVAWRRGPPRTGRSRAAFHQRGEGCWRRDRVAHLRRRGARLLLPGQSGRLLPQARTLSRQVPAARTAGDSQSAMNPT